MIWLQHDLKFSSTSSATSAEFEISRDSIDTFEKKRMDSWSNTIPMPMVWPGHCDVVINISIF